MYSNDRGYDEESSIEGEDYWYITRFGERLLQRKTSDEGTITEYGGPVGDGYTDKFGEA